jgi:hypothetical protein
MSRSTPTREITGWRARLASLVRHPRRDGYLGAAIAVLGLAIGLVAVVLAVSMLRGHGPPVAPSTTVPISAGQLRPLRLTKRQRADRATLDFSLVNFDRSTDTVTVDLTLVVPFDVYFSLRDEYTGKKLSNEVLQGSRIDPLVRVGLFIVRPDDPGRFDRFIPVKRLESGEPLQWRTRFALAGESRSFPEDWYVFSADIGLAGEHTYLPEAGGEQDYALPMDVDFHADSGMSDMRVSASARSDRTRVDVVLRSARNAELFAYLVALAPLAILFATLLMGAGHDHRGRYEPLAVVALTIVSIVPVRAVTVPADVTGLTRIDAVLGGEVGLAVAVLFVLLGRARWRGEAA